MYIDKCFDKRKLEVSSVKIIFFFGIMILTMRCAAKLFDLNLASFYLTFICFFYFNNVYLRHYSLIKYYDYGYKFAFFSFLKICSMYIYLKSLTGMFLLIFPSIVREKISKIGLIDNFIFLLIYINLFFLFWLWTFKINGIVIGLISYILSFGLIVTLILILKDMNLSNLVVFSMIFGSLVFMFNEDSFKYSLSLIHSKKIELTYIQKIRLFVLRLLMTIFISILYLSVYLANTKFINNIEKIIRKHSNIFFIHGLSIMTIFIILSLLTTICISNIVRYEKEKSIVI